MKKVYLKVEKSDTMKADMRVDLKVVTSVV